MSFLLQLLTLSKPSKRLGSIAIIIGAIATLATSAQAEGSKELTSSGGDRPFLEYYNSSSTTADIPRRNTIKVYAKSGETISLGSSAVGINNARILYRTPTGTQTACTSGTGYIPNRTAETTGVFTPCTITVTSATEGVWEIEFESPAIGATNNNPTPISASAAWTTQTKSDSWVTAWDVTVRDASGVIQPGRAFANYLALNMGDNGHSLSSKVYIQTVDGYGYQIDMNGIDPFGFTFFANNKGFRDSAGNPIYRSLQFVGANPGTMPSGFSFQLPTAPDNASTHDFTHKIFFNTQNTVTTPNGGPDVTMPTTAPSASGTTWLFIEPVAPPLPSNLAFTGIEGTTGFAGTNPLGGNFSFTSTQASAYSIALDLNGNGIYGDTAVVGGLTDRILVGTAQPGLNTAFWDGKDSNGTTIPANSRIFNAKVTQYAGEVHFPFLDPENNPQGLIIQRMKDPGASAAANPYQVFFDDRYTYMGGAFDYSLCAAGDPPANSGKIAPPSGINCEGSSSLRYGLNGVTGNATTGIHAWLSNFGNIRGMDTWAYYPSAYAELPGGFAIREADLSIAKTDNLATIAPGSTITYKLVVKNNGPSDVIGAKVQDIMPSQLDNVTWTCVTSSGSSCAAANGTGNIDTTVNLKNAGTATYTITAKVNPTATGPISNTATVIRPNDVNDPTDPNRTGAGNNTATDTTTIDAASNPLQADKTVASVIDADNSGSITAGDTLEYTIVVKNISTTISADNAILTDPIPADSNYAANSLQISAGSNAGGKSDTSSNDQAELNGANVVFRLGTGADSSTGGTLAPGEFTTIKFRVQIKKPITAGVTQISNQATVSTTGFPDRVSNDPQTATPDDPTIVKLSPRLRLVKRITALTSVNYSDVIPDPNDPNDDATLFWNNNYLRGRTGKGITAADTVPVKPTDSLEYTIYYLSDGFSPAQNVTLCDLIPENTTFIPNTYNGNNPKDGGVITGDFGIHLRLGANNFYLSNIEDAPDRGRFYPPGSYAPCGTNNEMIAVPNGAITVNLGSITNAVAKGTTNSFGFVRFRAKVK